MYLMGNTQSGGSDLRNRQSYPTPTSVRNAAARGDQRAFRQYLQSDIVETFDESFFSTISFIAGTNGHDGIIQVLSEYQKLDTYEALKGAIQSGRINVVTWLSEHNKLNIRVINEVVDCNEYRDLEAYNQGILNILRNHGLYNPCGESDWSDTDSDSTISSDSDDSLKETDHLDQDSLIPQTPDEPEVSPLSGGGCPCAKRQHSTDRFSHRRSWTSM